MFTSICVGKFGLNLPDTDSLIAEAPPFTNKTGEQSFLTCHMPWKFYGTLVLFISDDLQITFFHL